MVNLRFLDSGGIREHAHHVPVRSVISAASDHDVGAGHFVSLHRVEQIDSSPPMEISFSNGWGHVMVFDIYGGRDKCSIAVPPF